ncbi:conserved hypothetical protein [Candida tropicalis MYA-3404]|uniref:Uncharacterized protein n=1 Tax=Candida tropicalis (strain ATCC MYA-3404 / T1) TaxID=294747 RepID=C5MC64_CANTT|nr:conserved hypothetical protein [Candida tropicalis MYA-3404]EER33231.1 conserved hypothetical protein [Candida tropicalis MYA-3404]KAG4407062.1 hypothetical protein JTP64_004446 [Candida tropicalis]
MNVTSNGYYTQQYLNEQQRKQAVRSPYNQQNFYPNQSYSYSYYHPSSYSHSGSPKEFIVELDEKDPIPDSLPMEFTPSQKDVFMSNVRPRSYKSRSESTIYPPSGSHRSTASLPAEPVEYDDVESKDQLEETITPAQLNYINIPQQYTPYVTAPRGPYVPQAYYPRKDQSSPARHAKNKNNDYYLRQKKRYDDAKVVKPKMYSHKTIHDVFEDKSEKLDRYNPMDMVFESENDKPKPTFIDKMSNKLSKEKYEDYNYYDHRKKKSPPVKDVFVGNDSDDDYDITNDTEMVEVDEVVTVGEGKNKETKIIKKKVPLKKIMKQKLNLAKKELGRDFAMYSKNQREINEQLKRSKEELKKKKEAEKLAERIAEKERLKKEKLEQKRRLREKEKQAAKKKEEEEKEEQKNDSESIVDAKSESDSKSVKSNKEEEGEEDKGEDNAAEANAGWWPYLTSWLVYPEDEKKDTESEGSKKSLEEEAEEEQNGDDKESVKTGKTSSKSDISDVSSVKTVVYAPTPFEKNFKKVKTFSKNSKKFMKHWDEPATKMFHRELLVTPPSSTGSPSIAPTAKTRKTISIAPSSKKAISIAPSSKRAPSIAATSTKSSRMSQLLSGSENQPKEVIIECDPDEIGSRITEEMYYNPVTKQLESTPPTSTSSMLRSPKSIKSARTSDSRSMVTVEEEVEELEEEEEEKTGKRTPFQFQFDPNAPIVVVSTWINLIKRIQIMKMLFAPIDIIGEFIPGLQGVVVFIELVLFVWILYELSRLVDALCMMIKAFCAPMIAVGRFMNRVV